MQLYIRACSSYPAVTTSPPNLEPINLASYLLPRSFESSNSFFFASLDMPQPKWSNARPPISGDVIDPQKTAPVPETAHEENIHLLTSDYKSYELTSRKLKQPIALPVLTRGGPPLEFYRVVISRSVHEELKASYMFTDDPVHYERRYQVWVGIDMDEFGCIDLTDGFFLNLDEAVWTERITVQENTPLEGVLTPKRALWMEMYGYFGNWYEPEERKWAIIAAKRHVRLLHKLWSRGDLVCVCEEIHQHTYKVIPSNPAVVTCAVFDDYCKRPLDKDLIFPKVLKEKSILLSKEKGMYHTYTGN